MHWLLSADVLSSTFTMLKMWQKYPTAKLFKHLDCKLSKHACRWLNLGIIFPKYLVCNDKPIQKYYVLELCHYTNWSMKYLIRIVRWNKLQSYKSNYLHIWWLNVNHSQLSLLINTLSIAVNCWNLTCIHDDSLSVSFYYSKTCL